MARLNERGIELAVEWLNWLKAVRERPERTWVTYGRTLAAWLTWCDGLLIDMLDPPLERLEEFLGRQRTTGGIGSPATRKREAAALRGWYSWMYRRGHIPRDPAMDLYGPQVPRGSGRPIDDDDWIAQWALDLTPHVRATIGLGYYAGLRPAEVKSSRLGRTLVHVTRKGGDEQAVPWRDMAEIIASRLPHLLPNVMDLVNACRYVYDHKETVMRPSWRLNRIYETVCKRAATPFYTPHQLRHSSVTNLLRPEVNTPLHIVAELHGHKDINHTQTYIPKGADKLRSYFPELQDGPLRSEEDDE